MFDFDGISFFITLVIYLILNIVCTVFVVVKKGYKHRVVWALLPLPLLILVTTINSIVYRSVVDMDNPPYGTDYSGYFMGVVIVLGMLMMLFYVINITILIISSIRKGDKK